MLHLLSKIVLLGICIIFSIYNTSYSQNQTALAITNVTIIDGNGGDPAFDQTVLVRNGRIAEIGSAPSLKISKNIRVIDGKGKFLTPGFVDSNVHASIYGGMNRPETIIKYEEQNEELVTEFVQIQLKYGVTTIRDSFGALLLSVGPWQNLLISTCFRSNGTISLLMEVVKT